MMPGDVARINPVTIAVPLEGSDPESCAISALVFMLDQISFAAVATEGKLTPTQKARVARYLRDRYETEARET